MNIIFSGVIDRVIVEKSRDSPVKSVDSLSSIDFIPSVADIGQFRKELAFIVARSVIENNQQMNELLGAHYPDHLEHPYSDDAGKKTSQVIICIYLDN